jgi:cell division protein FtsW
VPNSFIEQESKLSSRRYYIGIWIVTFCLFAFGSIMIFSSTSAQQLSKGLPVMQFFVTQVAAGLAGFLFMFIFQKFNLKFLEKVIAPVGLLLALFLLACVPFAGKGENGNKSWLLIPGIGQFQPSEFAKVAVVLWFGLRLGRCIKEGSINHIGHIFAKWESIVILLILILIIIEKDIGTLIVYLIFIVGMLYLSGCTLKVMIPITILGVFVGYILMHSSDNRWSRVLATYSGECNIYSQDTLCYQVNQGLYALGTGGIMGVGAGASRSKWGWLPENKNDFIIPVIGEELGLWGTLGVLFFLGLLIYFLFKVVARHPDPGAKMVTCGVICWLVAQIMINVGAVLRIVPVIGVTLPFISAGASSLLAIMMALGIVLSFARTASNADMEIVKQKMPRGVVATTTKPLQTSEIQKIEARARSANYSSAKNRRGSENTSRRRVH